MFGTRIRASLDALRIHPHPEHHVLLAFQNLEEARIFAPLAENLIGLIHGRLTFLYVSVTSQGQPFCETAAHTSRMREKFTLRMPKALSSPASLQTLVCQEGQVWNGITQRVIQDKADILLVGCTQPEKQEKLVGLLDETSQVESSCHLVVICPSKAVGDSGNWETVKKIMMPLSGETDSTMALQIGCALAQSAQAEITILHVQTREQAAWATEDNQFESRFGTVLNEVDRIKRVVVAKGHLPDALLEESEGYHAIVMGAPREHPSHWHNALIESEIGNKDRTLILVKKPKSEPILHDTTVSDPKIINRPLTETVDKWFAENTYHSREFTDLRRLIALKEAREVTISLGLPALNEEQTVGKVIQTIKRALMDDAPLLDELILIDSDSQDRTQDIARDLGIPVYVHRAILPQYGTYHGKGDALWKSLYVLKGDIIVWIDTDIRNIDPRFVYGVVGPLLQDSRLQYVKGFYRRPIRQGDKLLAGGGGRVTELTVRPNLNLYFPELSGVIQPLSGEYAGRRRAMESVPFFCGYGVETGLLIDIYRRYGLNAIAQVDLLERIHRNQPLPALSKMSFAILQVFARRLEEYHKVELLGSINLSMNLIRYQPEQRYFLEPREIEEYERPPMVTIPEYQHKIRGW